MMRGCMAAAVFVFVACLALPAFGGNVGLGVIAGEPTGVSFKAWIGDSSALDAAVGWSLGENDWVYAHMDYLFHRYELTHPDLDRGIPWYYGVGGRILVREGHDSRVGLRVPFGLAYTFDDSRFDVFVEIAPIVNLVPSTEFDVSGGVGVRYWF